VFRNMHMSGGERGTGFPPIKNRVEKSANIAAGQMRSVVRGLLE